MTQVFISYRHTKPDQDLARALADFLRQRELPVFVDTQLLVGDQWIEEIETQLRASSYFVVLLSADSIRSDMVRREVKLAYELAKARGGDFIILPIRVAYSGALPYDLGAYLDPIQYAFWEQNAPFTPICEQIIAAINRQQSLPHRRPSGAADAAALQALADATEHAGAPLPSADPRLMSALDLRFEKGTMKAGSPFYIRRRADDQLDHLLQKEGETVIVKGMRQMGKSSLFAVALAAARARQHKAFYADFQLIDEAHLQTLDSLLRYLAHRLSREFRTAIKPADVWDEQLGAKDNLTDFIETAILANAQAPVLFLLDEADLIFKFPYRDHFFSLIRAWHNLRATNERWTRLNLAIAHSTEPYLWIADINQSPFNVGFPIRLDDFDAAQVADLNERHGRRLQSAAEVEELMKLVGGHPYLVRQSLFTLVNADWTLDELQRHAPHESGPFGDHLRRYNALLRENKELKDALRQVLRDRRCDDESCFQRLRAAGLIRGESGDDTQIRCELYAAYFRVHLR